MTEFGKSLEVKSTPIPGLLIVDLPVHGDNRGWFKENWQREKMTALGLPDFGPVQNNISFNDTAGTTRGIHAEPWDKWISVAQGKIFGAWVDLREGPSFGRSFTAELDPSRAVFVPRGVGNSFQTLEDNTSYAYLVNDHWSASASYSNLNLADETVAIPWPIPLAQAALSEKDKNHPRLAEVTPLPPRKILVLGADGQLGRALKAEFGSAGHLEYATRADLDLTDPALSSLRHWRDYDVVINAAAFTAVDAAESAEGRKLAWEANAQAVGALAAIAAANRITLVQVSTDYVFDGAGERPYLESDPLCPLGVYGQSKAGGDIAAATAPRHYIVRTAWVVGDGKNFVRTTVGLAERGIDPAVVSDQVGRLTFTDDLARGIRHLIESAAPFGVYNFTSQGEPSSWAEVARRTFELSGHDPSRIREVSTAEYFAAQPGPIAPRPRNSVLDLSKIQASGYQPVEQFAALAAYLN